MSQIAVYLTQPVQVHFTIRQWNRVVHLKVFLQSIPMLYHRLRTQIYDLWLISICVGLSYPKTVSVLRINDGANFLLIQD